jgi:hypothetical protein
MAHEAAHRQEAEVPFIRDWFTPAYRTWARGMYGGRSIWFASGCFLLIVLPFIAIKAAIFWGVVVVMLAAFLVTGITDTITYRWRLKAATSA